MSEAPAEGAALAGSDDQQQEAPALTEVEQIAIDLGWKPKGQFEGPEGNWKPASDFLRKIPNTRDMKREIKGLRDTVERMASAATKQTERALKEQADEINARFAQAVENKDTKGAAKAAQEMRDLEAEATTSNKPSGNVEADFARDNPWYGKDDDATAYAVAISQREASKGRTVEEQLEAVQTGVKKRFPELFGQQEAPAPRKEPASVAAPSRGGSNRGNGYADLPADVKRAADDFAELFATRHGKDRDESRKQYARDYFDNAKNAA